MPNRPSPDDAEAYTAFVQGQLNSLLNEDEQSATHDLARHIFTKVDILDDITRVLAAGKTSPNIVRQTKDFRSEIVDVYSVF